MSMCADSWLRAAGLLATSSKSSPREGRYPTMLIANCVLQVCMLQAACVAWGRAWRSWCASTIC